MRANLIRRLDRIAGHIETAPDLDGPECPECNPPVREDHEPAPELREGHVTRWAARRPDGSKLTMVVDLTEGDRPARASRRAEGGAREEQCTTCGRWSVVHVLAMDLGD